MLFSGVQTPKNSVWFMVVSFCSMNGTKASNVLVSWKNNVTVRVENFSILLCGTIRIKF